MTSVKCLNCGNQFSDERRGGSCKLCGSQKRLNAARFFNIVPEIAARDEVRRVIEILIMDDPEWSWKKLAREGPSDPTSELEATNQ